jgi:hypothetical protein
VPLKDVSGIAPPLAVAVRAGAGMKSAAPPDTRWRRAAPAPCSPAPCAGTGPTIRARPKRAPLLPPPSNPSHRAPRARLHRALPRPSRGLARARRGRERRARRVHLRADRQRQDARLRAAAAVGSRGRQVCAPARAEGAAEAARAGGGHLACRLRSAAAALVVASAPHGRRRPCLPCTPPPPPLLFAGRQTGRAAPGRSRGWWCCRRATSRFRCGCKKGDCSRLLPPRILMRAPPPLPHAVRLRPRAGGARLGH